MDFITSENEESSIKNKNIYELYSDAENKGVSLTPFDIYKYVDTFDNIEAINDVLESNQIGVIYKQKIEGITGYVIAVNKYLPYEYQRTILARLFAHCILHKELFQESLKIKNLWTSDEMAQEANILASKLLIPETELFKFINGGSSVGKIADHFKVSVNMAKFRALNEGLISEEF